MRKLLTALDVRILQALCEIGPRNLSKVARALGIPRATLRFRITRMHNNPKIALRCGATVYHTNLGMKKALVRAKARPGKEKLLVECLKANDYWLYTSRTYGEGEGASGLYAIPAEHADDFQRFTQALQDLDVAENVEVYWSTCFQAGKVTPTWFDEESSTWNFRWGELLSELEEASAELPFTLVDPPGFPNYGDETDVFMLKELEIDAFQHLQNIAQKLGISLQRARYHYIRHILERNLLEGFHVFIYSHEPLLSVSPTFIVRFYDNEQLAKFANSLLDKHFIWSLGKILRENALIVVSRCIPRKEFRNFVDFLSDLARKQMVKDYIYWLLDYDDVSQQPIPYNLFRKNRWIYEHEKHMAKLEEMARQFQKNS